MKCVSLLILRDSKVIFFPLSMPCVSVHTKTVPCYVFDPAVRSVLRSLTSSLIISIILLI